MSYAQRHRTRLELHQGTLDVTHIGTETPLSRHTPPRKAAAAAAAPLHGDHSSENGGGPKRSNSSLLRANSARIQQGHGTGIDIAAWSDATSNAVTGERQPFQLLQHTPPKNEPPRLKASRKQFASPHVSTAQSEANQSLLVSLPIVVNSASPDAASKDPLATDLRTGKQSSTPSAAVATGAAAGVASAPADDASASSHRQADAHQGTLAAGEISPSPIPVSHQPSQPQQMPPPPPPAFADSSAPSSARASTSQWPASETFTTRLRSIMETRQQIEALVQKQREDEEEMAHAIAALDEHSQLDPSSQQQSPNSMTPRSTAAVDKVSRQAYEQVLMERNVAFAALREFKEKGNAIVHRLYDTVKSQQEQSLELVATVEALKKANKRLKEAVSSDCAGRASDNGTTAVSGTVAELQQQVNTQRRVIEQMDQLMQNADRMLLTMRARVEAAERKAASSAVPLNRSQLPPLPKSSGAVAAARPASTVNAATAATPEAVAAIERLSERYPADQDVATVAAQQQLLLERLAQLRQSLKQEEAQRLHLEEVYGATSEETARNVALLEERLQRAENPRGVPFASGSNANNTSALRQELRKFLEEEGNGVNKALPPTGDVEEERENRKQQPGAPEEVAAQPQRPRTPSNVSAHTSSRSSTPTRSLFTAVSVGDVNSTTAANEATEGGAAERKEIVVVPSTTTIRTVVIPQLDTALAAGAAKEEAPAKMAAPLPVVTSPKVNEPPSSPPQQAEGSCPQRPRAFLTRRRSASSDKGDGAAAVTGSPTAATEAPQGVGIPVPDASSLGNSPRRSFNSRSSSASRRIVDFRPAVPTDMTSRGLVSMSDVEEEEETVDVDGEDVEEKVRRSKEKSSNRISGFTGVTPTITPTAIHSASSPLPDTSTSAELSAKRQQRLHQQMEELDKMEADVTSVVGSLDA
jgi:hypothetical protein